MSSLNDEDRENLAAYLDGELDEKAAQELEAKLNRDADARKEMESLRKAWSMLEFLPRPEPSANFTNRTMERLTMALPRGAATARLAPLAPRSRLFQVAWAGAVLLALVLGAVAGSALWRDPVAEALAQHRRLLEHFLLFEVVVDVKFLESLDDPDLFGEETPADDPDHKPCSPPEPNEKQLLSLARAFVELSPERREQMVKLDRDLFAPESDAVRERLLSVACRLREWFDHLGVKEREKVLHEPDHGRLMLIKQLRQLQRSWDQAGRDWNEFRTLHLKDLPDDVQEYYKDYLKFMLTAEEKQQLERAEGPAFMRTLVQLADKHPLALEGPKKLADVPKKVRDSLALKGKLAKLIKKETWPDFAREMVDLANKKGVSLPKELWPTNDNGLSPPMQAFVAKLEKVLSKSERESLRRATGKWPEYPNAIRDLAKAHEMQPPWLTLPPPRERWDSYRVPAK